jgi:hypothetical protein
MIKRIRLYAKKTVDEIQYEKTEKGQVLLWEIVDLMMAVGIPTMEKVEVCVQDQDVIVTRKTMVHTRLHPMEMCQHLEQSYAQ